MNAISRRWRGETELKQLGLFMRNFCTAFIFSCTLCSFVRAAQNPNQQPQQPYSTTAAASQRSTLNARAKSPAEAAQSAAQLMQQNGGSLLRATLAQQPDPAQAPLSG